MNTSIKTSWEELKNFATLRNLSPQHIVLNGNHVIQAKDDWYHLYTAITVDSLEDETDRTDFVDNWLNKDKCNLQLKKINSDGIDQVNHIKSFRGKSTTFVTPNYADRTSWYGDTDYIQDENLTTQDNINYSSSGLILDWKSIPNNARLTQGNTFKPIVKKNGSVITSGFSISHSLSKVTFLEANAPTDIITLTYHKPLSSRLDVTPTAGKVLKIDYLEVQFSEGCTLPEDGYLVFQPIYNGPAIPALGIPANIDIVLKSYEYHTSKEFLNESTKAHVCPPFMELTKNTVILPWDYLTGHVLKPKGDLTTDLSKNEFNTLRIELMSSGTMNNADIATGTVYCLVEDL